MLTKDVENMQKNIGLTNKGKIHDAFWEAFKSLPANIRAKFSIKIGREFADVFYEEIKDKDILI